MNQCHSLKIAIASSLLINLIPVSHLHLLAEEKLHGLPFLEEMGGEKIRKKLIGTWKFINPNSKSSNWIIIFTPEGKLYSYNPDNSGKENKVTLNYYRFNTNFNPAALDIIRIGYNKSEIFPTIFQLNDNKLNLAISPNYTYTPQFPRPKEFTPENPLFEKVSDQVILPPNVTIIPREEQMAKERETVLEKYMQLVHTAQIDYYTKYQKFAVNFEELNLDKSILQDPEFYVYKIIADSNKSDQIIMTATAKKAGLKSYTGTVFVIKDETETSKTISVICVTNKPEKNPPKIPEIINKLSGEIKCLDSSTILK